MGNNKQKLNILVVEDSPAWQMLIKIHIHEGLRKDECEVSVAEGIAAAMDLIKQPNIKYDAVITDMILKDGNGITLAGKIKTIAGDNLPIVIYSAHDPVMFKHQIKTSLIKDAFKKLDEKEKLKKFLKELYNLSIKGH